jgi:hypothetical protein
VEDTACDIEDALCIHMPQPYLNAWTHSILLCVRGLGRHSCRPMCRLAVRVVYTRVRWYSSERKGPEKPPAIAALSEDRPDSSMEQDYETGDSNKCIWIALEIMRTLHSSMWWIAMCSKTVWREHDPRTQSVEAPWNNHCGIHLTTPALPFHQCSLYTKKPKFDAVQSLLVFVC